MTPPPVARASEEQDTDKPAPRPAKRARKRPEWMEDPDPIFVQDAAPASVDSEEDSDDDAPVTTSRADLDITLLDENGNPVRPGRKGRPKFQTIGDLKESGDSIERVERVAPQGRNKVITAADLVRDMINSKSA